MVLAYVMVCNVCELALVDIANPADDLVPLADLVQRTNVFRSTCEEFDLFFLGNSGHPNDKGAVHTVEPDGSSRELHLETHHQ